MVLAGRSQRPSERVVPVAFQEAPGAQVRTGGLRRTPGLS